MGTIDDELTSIQRDDDFYLQSAIFLVEDRLFKVPIRNFILESEVFQTMFQLPQDPARLQDGLTDDNSIRLEGVKKDDFKRLLRVMYAQPFAREHDITEEDWISVLSLSTRWDMERLRKLAIDKLTPGFQLSNKFNPHKLVVLGLNFNVESWQILGLYSLVTGVDPMTEDDAAKIGVSAALKVSAVREWKLGRMSRLYPQSPSPSSQEIIAKMRELFNLKAST